MRHPLLELFHLSSLLQMLNDVLSSWATSCVVVRGSALMILTSSPTTSEQLACKPPAFSFVSPTNQSTPLDPANLDGASVLEEFHTRRLDVSGAVVEESATYFQTTAHSSPFSAPKGTSSTLPFPHSTQLPGSNLFSPSAAEPKPALTPEAPKKTTLTSRVLSRGESPRTSSPPPPACAPAKSNAALYIPVRIVTHSLSPSPKPFTSSFHGSSSTICSQMSSSGNLSKSGVKSPVPSRLSLLTAILKSKPSHQRPFSPASCPTFSLNSLASSTLTLDQKPKQTPPTPKKSLSSCSLRARSPDPGERQDSELTQRSFHVPFSAPSAPVSQLPSHSPAKRVGSGLVSLNVEKAPSPTLKSNTVLSLLQTDTSAGLPPVPPSPSLSSWKGKQDGDLRGPEKPRNIYTHPSTLASPALSSLSPPSNQRATLPPPEKCFHPSPALSSLINRSQRASPQLSGQQLNPSALPSLPVSSASSAPLAKAGSSSFPCANLPSQALQLSPPALHPHGGSGTLPSRLGKSESTISDRRSPVSTPSLPIPLTRTEELISPCALSMSTGPENKKPKQYKTKSSYKAFAAIPTNTLLLEQKALDEPAKTESVSKDNPLDLPVEVITSNFPCFRYAIPKLILTQYLVSILPVVFPCTAQATKPGVIRPVTVKSKILLRKEEEVYEPNPFSKYLEDNSDLFSEQVSIPMRKYLILL
uniref:Muscular LMNA interacting protein n=1 Tax=Prolemur simus TaxID=1328070 RepID=A0A8C9DSN1_PROSS